MEALDAQDTLPRKKVDGGRTGQTVRSVDGEIRSLAAAMSRKVVRVRCA